MAGYQYNPNIEQWKDITDFPGYQASDHGRIKSLWHQFGRNSAVLHDIPRRIMKQCSVKTYKHVSLRKDHKNYFMRVSRLVLMAFVGPCPEGMEACHNDGNPPNNYLINLRWDTHKSNQADRIKHNTNYGPKGESQHMSKLTKQEVIKIRQLSEHGVPQRKIAALFGISHCTTFAVIHRKTWAHVL